MEARKRAMQKRKKLRTLGKSRSTESEDEENEEEEGEDFFFILLSLFCCGLKQYISKWFFILGLLSTDEDSVIGDSVVLESNRPL